LGLLLFRIIELDAGQILIDGVDIRKLGLRDLRQGIAMIPQDPVLFRMSVRQNIDPFSRFDDARIWECLRLVCMDKAIEALGDGLGHLCAEGGSNFSVGQMQLLCIARALLQEPGMVMMDEATANVDVASDEIIQRTIREHFKDATVLTIAHRLSTIVDSSKIAVFDQGELKEFGSPQELAVRSGGLFRDLVIEAHCEIPGVVLTPDQEMHQDVQN
jgi:ABC-type multidrug transport system fused ATPase/permease subunit